MELRTAEGSTAVMMVPAHGRYRLDRRWGDLENTQPRMVLFILAYPGLGDEKTGDRHIWRATRLARLWGYDGFSLVALSPRYLLAGGRTLKHAEQDATVNDDFIVDGVRRCEIAVPAWGVDQRVADAAERAISMIKDKGLWYKIRLLDPSGRDRVLDLLSSHTSKATCWPRTPE